MKVSHWGGRLGMCCLFALASLIGCRRQIPSTFDRNLAPETVITGAPAESTEAYFRVHLKWYGVDRDGLVDFYEYSVTDTNKAPGEDNPAFSGYHRTDRTDSLFVLRADRPQLLGHRFYVRAVDNEGKADPSPAWAYFVASDFNPPYVTFKEPGTGSANGRATGSWIDRNGNLRSVSIHSSSRNSPTDTIGVGGSVSFAWTGYDVDVGDTVTGFAYRLSAEPLYHGGTLADTAYSVSYARPAGATLSSYFSGNDALLVHALDVAGARTNPDSARSYVVNFGPLAWVVDPNNVAPPLPKRVFTDLENQVTWPSGTWLADGSRQIVFRYTGYDDPRDQSLNPNNPIGIIGFQYRVLKNGGGTAYQDVRSWLAYPQVSVFNEPSPLSTGLQSGDYVILLRSRDELGRFGKPDTLRVRVNYAPYFEYVRYADTSGVEHDMWTPDWPDSSTASFGIPAAPGGGYEDLGIRFNPRDDHLPPPDQDAADPNPVVEAEPGRVLEYVVRLNGSRGGFVSAPLDSVGQPVPVDLTFPVNLSGDAGVVRDGLNRLELLLKDNGGRITSLEVEFLVTLE